MKAAIVCLIGLVFAVSASAEPLLEGRVRLASGEPVADAQVRIFDLSDLRQGAIARALTDGTGYFALPLAALGGRALPTRFELGPNYPNPFNPSTIIPYQLAASAEVRLEVFNLLGQRITTLVDGERPAGFYTATWHATDGAGRAVGAGVYIYRMTVGVESQTGRMVLVDGQAGVSAAGAASVLSGVSGGGSDGAESQVYGLIVSGEGLAPYVDSSFRVEAGMAPVELMVSSGPHSAGKATDDDCAFCDLFDGLHDGQEAEEARPSGKAQAILEAPSPPTNLRFDAPTDSSCTVRWDAADGATDYDVNYKPAVGGRWTNEPHRGIGLSNTIDDLQPNTEYRWAVRAENSEGTSEWIHGPNFTTLPSSEDDGLSDAPASPTNLRFDAPTDSSCTVRWDAADGATDYDVNYKPAVGGRWTIEPHRGIGLSNTIDDLQPNTEYRWAVRAENSEGTSEWIHGPNFTTLPEEGPDLIVQSPSVSAVVLTPGQAFTLNATVHNQGDEQAAATMLHYYRSNNSTITSSDTEVGTDAIDALDASATSAESIALTAPTSVSAEVGIYYGACVGSVSGESNTDNNCSSAVKITVSGQVATEDEDDEAEEEEEDDEAEEEEEDDEAEEEEIDDTPVTIPDAKLRAAIAAALGKARGATITKAEMETLTTLEAGEAGISDLTGLEYAINLTRLDLWLNHISDVSPLSGLTNLTLLNLGGNHISDVSPLSGLTNLAYLYLNGNHISDVSPLSGLTSLTRLSLGDNISDISPLSGLTNLIHLYLFGNKLTDISALSGLTNLTQLGLSDNPLNASSINDHIPALQARGVTVEFDPVIIIDDPTPVTIPDANLRAAIAAALDKARGATITKGEMSTLLILDAHDAGISDLTRLEFATNLKELWLSGNNISDISALSGLTNLGSLSLFDNSITDVSALSGLTNLTYLAFKGNRITDVSPLSGLTNLTHLYLNGNRITDVSSLSGLTKLIRLELGGNRITDVSPLSGLTNLESLSLWYCDLTDVSALSGLTKLIRLWLGGNRITDVSPLSGLTNLESLNLEVNNITDISALRDLADLSMNSMSLRGNPLNVSSVKDYIPALIGRGVEVYFDPLLRESDFDIELVFLDRFTEEQKRVIQHAARRWASIITEDLPDQEFTRGWSGACGDQLYEIPPGDRIDDLRIYVINQPGKRWGGVISVRTTSNLPVVGCMSVNGISLDSALHEIGHVMGIGALWGVSGFLQDFPGADPHFNGPRAIAAFNAAGGRGYAGAKVPVAAETEGRGAGSHWRSSVFAGLMDWDELMDWAAVKGSSHGALSAITIQSLADLGYSVDVTQADPYTLPGAAAKASAKVAAPSTHAQPEFLCGVGEQREPIYVVDEQGYIIRTLGD